MKKFIPYEKLSKKEQRKIDQINRKDWNGVNPVTHIVPDKKKYKRKEKHPNNYTE